MPKISVVLPVYNGASYLDAAIQSVLNQSFKDYELIIVDDCSTDETAIIAQRFAANTDKIIYHRNQINLKLPASLNVGFQLATGEYWTWTSCDNTYQINAFEILKRELDANPEIGLVYSDMQLINEAGEFGADIIAGQAEDLILRNVIGACFMYRADVAHQAGKYNEEMFLCEDYEYWVRLALLTQFKAINLNLYYYRAHNKSLSHTYKKEVIARGISVQRRYYKYFIKSRNKAAQFYAYLRARDIYNPFRHFYLLQVLFYSPMVFGKEIYRIIAGRIQNNV